MHPNSAPSHEVIRLGVQKYCTIPEHIKLSDKLQELLQVTAETLLRRQVATLPEAEFMEMQCDRSLLPNIKRKITEVLGFSLQYCSEYVR